MKIQNLFSASLVGLFAILLVELSYGEVIDFESIPVPGADPDDPGSMPVDGLEISTQFEEKYGVSFSMSDGTFPRIAEVGYPRTAFIGPNNSYDTPDAAHDVGGFFLTDNSSLGLKADLIIDFKDAVSASSGVLLDVDFEEEWTISVYDDHNFNNKIDEIFISDRASGAGDGVATAWSFEHKEKDIKRIVFSGTKPNQDLFGLGFDHFSPSLPLSLPECKSEQPLFTIEVK
ncbi:hypothetical protein ACJJIE_05355 [Microbulbifer sp. TRSA001]|uniref:hypothetical protein n=1 Tax=Microbulbifer sp. TRSA001 TaxID=3243381 RepID=UPI004039A5F7